jgi:NadR type nicotinamide-nucleotide adenylyltransferase
VNGLVLGKFLPPHLGHVYLVEFARAYATRVTVVVGTLAREPIPGELRFRWMRELFPDLDVVHLTDENPQEPHEHPRFWDIWRESLLRITPNKPDLVFASEAYGERLAKELGARFVPVDIARSAVSVSGTAIRNDPMKHWRYLPRCVRPYFAKRVCVVGPESTGKSTLARDLAAHFGTTWVPEYARSLLEPRVESDDPGETAQVTRDDMIAIARGQMASEEALARNAERVLFSDTDALTTLLWNEHFFDKKDPALEELAARHTHDLYLLTSPDVPYVQDAVRYAPKERAAFFDRMRTELDARKRRFVVLDGHWEARRARAIAAVDELVGTRAPSALSNGE